MAEKKSFPQTKSSVKINRENQRIFEKSLRSVILLSLKEEKLVKRRLINFREAVKKLRKLMEMSSKESTTTNSSDGAGTHHSRGDSVPRSSMDHRSLLMKRKSSSSIPISASSIRSRSSCGDSIGGSSRNTHKPPVTVTYKSVTTSGKMFSKKTTSVDCGVFVKDPGLVFNSFNILSNYSAVSISCQVLSIFSKVSL